MTSHFPPINRFRFRYQGCRMSAPGYHNSALLHNVTSDNIYLCLAQTRHCISGGVKTPNSSLSQ